MTQDPFDDLEQQLKNSVAQRRTRRVRVSGRALIAVAAALVLTGGVAAGATLLSRDAETAAVNRALARGQSAAMTKPACALTTRNQAGQVVAGAPSEAVLSQLGVFRRRQRPSDLELPPKFTTTPPPTGSVFLKNSVRIAQTPDGARVVLFVTRGLPRFPGTPADPIACATATQSESIKAAANDNATVRGRVEKITTARLQRARAVATGARDSINFVQLTSRGRVAGASATYVSSTGKIPALASYGQGKLNGRRTVNISGLVPDGITTVRAIDRSGPTKRRVSPVTVAVHDNVYSVVASQRMGPRVTLDWRNTQGEVVRRVHVRY